MSYQYDFLFFLICKDKWASYRAGFSLLLRYCALETLSQRHFSKCDFPSGKLSFFPSSNFPEVRVIGLASETPQTALDSGAAARMNKRGMHCGKNMQEGWQLQQGHTLGSCRLLNCIFGKLSLGKIPMGCCRLYQTSKTRRRLVWYSYSWCWGKCGNSIKHNLLGKPFYKTIVNFIMHAHIPW